MSKPTKLNKIYITGETLTHTSVNKITSKIDDVIDYIGNGKLIIKQNGSVVSNDFTANKSSDTTVELDGTESVFPFSGFIHKGGDKKTEEEAESESKSADVSCGGITIKFWDGMARDAETQYNAYNVIVRDSLTTFVSAEEGAAAYTRGRKCEIEFDMLLNNSYLAHEFPSRRDSTGAYKLINATQKFWLNGANPRNKINGLDMRANNGKYNRIYMDFSDVTKYISAGGTITYSGRLHCVLHFIVKEMTVAERTRIYQNIATSMSGYLCLRDF